MIEFVNRDIQFLAVTIPSACDYGFILRWRRACDDAIGTCPVSEIVTHEYSYSYDSRFCPVSSSQNERHAFPEKGIQLIKYAEGGWKLHLLESGKLLFSDFQVETDKAVGWSLGYDEELFDYRSVTKETENDIAGLRLLFERLEDIRQRVRVTAYKNWEVRQRFSGKYRDSSNDVDDWLLAKRLWGIADELWI